jgi:hypothetical protein
MSKSARPRTWLRSTEPGPTGPARGSAPAPRQASTTKAALRLFGVLALMTPLACGSDNNNPPGSNSGSGGTNGGGTGGGSGGGAGNSGGGGSGAGGSGSRPDGGGVNADVMLPPINESGMASAKFCNPLSAQSGDVTFTLEVGTKKVLLTAKSGECTPLKGVACPAISAGTIPVRVLLEGEAILEGVWGPITANTEVLFIMTLDDQNFPDLDGGTLRAEVKCNTLDLETLFGGGADGGAGGADAARPPRTPKIVVDWSRFATLERIGLKPTAQRARLGKTLTERP